MKFVKYHNVVLPGPVKDSFANLAALASEQLGLTIEPMDGYKSEAEVIQEIRARIKNADQVKSLDDVFVDALDDAEFEPPLKADTVALRSVTGNEMVVTIPHKSNMDPRTTGRIVQIGPKSIVNPTLLYFLVHNAGRFGFVHYGPQDPTIWYWRGDKDAGVYTAEQVVSTFTDELAYLL